SLSDARKESSDPWTYSEGLHSFGPTRSKLLARVALDGITCLLYLKPKSSRRLANAPAITTPTMPPWSLVRNRLSRSKSPTRNPRNLQNHRGFDRRRSRRLFCSWPRWVGPC